jgi:hypothetical protein
MRIDERPLAASDPLASPQVGLNRVTSKLLDAPHADASTPPTEPRTNREAEPAAPAAAHADA